MSVKYPARVYSKRSSSFYGKKAITPVTFTAEDFEVLNKKQSGTPDALKNSRAVSYADTKYNAFVPSKNSLQSRYLDTPKLKRDEIRPNPMLENKILKRHEIFDKIGLYRKNTRSPEEFKAQDQSALVKVKNLANEVERLQGIIDTMKVNKKSEEFSEESLNEYRFFKEKLIPSFRRFVEKTKELIERLMSVSNDYLNKDSTNFEFAVKGFNEELEGLKPFFTEDVINKNLLVLSEIDKLDTGRFRSISVSISQSSYEAFSKDKSISEAIALKNYESDAHGELIFKAGDRIQILSTENPDFWLGKIGEKIGKFPKELVLID